MTLGIFTRSLLTVLILVSMSAVLEAKNKVSELIAAADKSVLLRTVRFSPPFHDSPQSFKGEDGLKEGGYSQDLIRKFEIVDPIFYVTDGLCEFLAKNYGVAKPLPSRLEVKSLDTREIVSQSGLQSGLILDLRNVVWLTLSAPGHPESYLLAYTMELRLVDAATGRVICSDEYRGGSSRGNLYARRSENGAAEFKEELANVGRDALAHFRRTLAK